MTWRPRGAVAAVLRLRRRDVNDFTYCTVVSVQIHYILSQDSHNFWQLSGHTQRVEMDLYPLKLPKFDTATDAEHVANLAGLNVNMCL